MARYAGGGKTIGKKDVAQQAIAYDNVFVARIAMGANPQQTLQRPTLPLAEYRKHEGRYHVVRGHNQYAPIPGLPAHP